MKFVKYTLTCALLCGSAGFAGCSGADADVDPTDSTDSAYTQRTKVDDVTCRASVPAPNRINAYVESNKLGFSWFKFIPVPVAPATAIDVEVRLSTTTFFRDRAKTMPTGQSQTVAATGSVTIDHTQLQKESDPGITDVDRKDIKPGSKGILMLNRIADSFVVAKTGDGGSNVTMLDFAGNTVGTAILRASSAGLTGKGSVKLNLAGHAVNLDVTCTGAR